MLPNSSRALTGWGASVSSQASRLLICDLRFAIWGGQPLLDGELQLFDLVAREQAQLFQVTDGMLVGLVPGVEGEALHGQAARPVGLGEALGHLFAHQLQFLAHGAAGQPLVLAGEPAQQFQPQGGVGLVAGQPGDTAEAQQPVVGHVYAQGAPDGDGQRPVGLGVHRQAAQPAEEGGVVGQAGAVFLRVAPVAVAAGGIGVAGQQFILPEFEASGHVLLVQVEGFHAGQQAGRIGRIEAEVAVEQGFLERPVRHRLGGEQQAARPALQVAERPGQQGGLPGGVGVDQPVAVAQHHQAVAGILAVELLHGQPIRMAAIPHPTEVAPVEEGQHRRVALLEESRQPPEEQILLVPLVALLQQEKVLCRARQGAVLPGGEAAGLHGGLHGARRVEDAALAGLAAAQHVGNAEEIGQHLYLLLLRQVRDEVGCPVVDGVLGFQLSSGFNPPLPDLLLPPAVNHV